MSKYAHMLDDGLFFMRTVEQFTDMRSHYVCNRYLTDRVKALGLARYLRAQHKDSELRKDGEKAYADIFESLVGAIYLDSYQNDALIRAFILRQLGIEPKRPPEEIEAFDYDSLRVSATAEASEVALEEPESAADVPAVQTDKPEGEDTPASDEPIQEAPAPVEVEEALLKPAETAPQAVTEVPPVPEKAETVPASVAPTEETPAPVATLPVEAPVTAVTVIRPKQEALADFCRQWGLDQPTYGQTPPNAPNSALYSEKNNERCFFINDRPNKICIKQTDTTYILLR
jgi:outer membrane biosynthesis protein TonB